MQIIAFDDRLYKALKIDGLDVLFSDANLDPLICSGFDTISMWLPYSLRDASGTRLRRQLKSCFRSFEYFDEHRKPANWPNYIPFKLKSSPLHQCLLTFQSPTIEALRIVKEWLEIQPHGHREIISRVDFCKDIICQSAQQASLLASQLRFLLFMPYSRKELRTVKQGSYARQKGQKNLVLYADRVSKFTNTPTVHIEFRLMSRTICQHQGVVTIDDLMGMDTQKKWHEFVKFLWIDYEGLGRAHRRKARKSIKASDRILGQRIIRKFTCSDGLIDFAALRRQYPYYIKELNDAVLDNCQFKGDSQRFSDENRDGKGVENCFKSMMY